MKYKYSVNLRFSKVEKKALTAFSVVAVILAFVLMPYLGGGTGGYMYGNSDDNYRFDMNSNMPLIGGVPYDESGFEGKEEFYETDEAENLADGKGDFGQDGADEVKPSNSGSVNGSQSRPSNQAVLNVGQNEQANLPAFITNVQPNNNPLNNIAQKPSEKPTDKPEEKPTAPSKPSEKPEKAPIPADDPAQKGEWGTPVKN